MRQFKYTLRTRVAVLAAIVSLLMGLLLSASVYLLQERLEQDLIGATLQRTLAGTIGQDLAGSSPETENILLYGPGVGPVPDELRALPPGLHEIGRAGRSFEVVVEDTGAGRYYLAYDESEHERGEVLLVTASIAIVVIALCAAGAVSYYAAGRAIAPLSHFATRLRYLRPDDTGPALQPDYAHTEVGEIAGAFDRYRARLSGFIEREREFTANASHELRTPLAIVQSAAELLRLPNLPRERQQRAAQRIEVAARQTSEILNALLYLAREQGEGIDSDCECRVDTVATALVDEYRSSERETAIDLQVDEPVTVAARSGLVLIVVRNLLDNAVRYADGGRITVTVGSGRLAVADSGPGMPAADIPRVFARHARGDGREGIPGRGLGLTISARICELQGWALDFQSEPGRGSSASVQFRH